MITRRHALKLAASLPVVVPAIARADADRALDLPLDPPAKTDDPSIYNPVEFAESLSGHAYGWLRDATGHMAPEALAEMEQAFHDLEQAVPALTMNPRITHLWEMVNEKVWNFATEVEWSGIRAGAAYENLRLAMLTPVRTCWECAATYSRGRATCATCNGTGVVATPGVAAR